MRKIIVNITILFCILILSSFSIQKFTDTPQTNQIILAFITYNGFGNNLYIDNISIGERFMNDVAVTSINNIKKDTSFTPGLNSISIIPEVNVTNLGLANVPDSFRVTMTIASLGYSSIDSVPPLNTGQSITIYFDSLLIIPGSDLDIKVYSSLQNDTNRTNDTLEQYSLILPGVRRNVLIEEWTSSTSLSSSSHDPFLNSFIDSNLQTVVPIKYHLGIPPPGNDSMYLYNPLQSEERRNYYFVNSVPTTIMDGKTRISLPYYVDSILTKSYNYRIETGTPLSINVTDIRLTGDTIQSTIDVNIMYALPQGDYRLRVMAIERLISYLSPPGTTSDSMFYDVFRKAYPDSVGTLISNNAGSYQFVYKYLRDPVWVDSMIYTAAFIQNDNTKEIINSAKGKTIVLPIRKLPQINYSLDNKPDIDFGISDIINYYNPIILGNSDSLSIEFNFELFEGPFPPPGFQVFNPDGNITFSEITKVNGISFGGNKCVKMAFYDYNDIGQKDTMITRVFDSVSYTDTLRFDYSYAQYLSSYVDSLIVIISTDGGSTYSTIFEKAGKNLATSPATTISYAPSSANQWRTFYYPLSQVLPPTNIQGNILDKFILSQNYPNPFNPSTTIKYVLHIPGKVSIKIYDITGKLVVALVNKKQEANSYEIEFKAANFSSGIYFYSLIVDGNFVDTKKMVFIK
ncbi:T9SS type A sorting domain-containing protein [Bacteroidota bacterium]